MSVEKVLVLMPMADGQTGPAIVNAFEELGCEVCGIDTNTEADKILDSVSTSAWDLVFCGREPALVPLINDIREATDVRVVVYNVDVRDDVNEFAALFPLFRRASAFYTVGLGNVPGYRAQGINAFWLPQGLQKEVYKPVDVSENDIEMYGCDVCFIGRDRGRGLHEGRTEVLDAIERMGVNYKWWGCRGNPELWDEDHNKAVICSKINIAHSGWPKVAMYWSVRGYKILGAGGFLLANYHEKMEKWLPVEGPEKALDYYRDIDELKEKITYYLEHEDERKAIAARGLRWVQSHTYTERMRNVIEHVQSPQFFYHHYVDVRDCNMPVPDDSKQESQVQHIIADSLSGDEILATITTKETVDWTRKLLRSIRDAGNWDGRIDVFTEMGDSAVPDALREFDVVIRPLYPWYRDFGRYRTTHNLDARYLKPAIYDHYDEGTDVLFMDGADTLVFSAAFSRIFELLKDKPVVLTPAEEKETTLTPGYRELFHLKGNIQRYNSGVWAFRVCNEATRFFTLWKAFCAWSIAIGHGDMLAMMMAAANSDAFVVADRVYNYLPAYPLNIVDGKPRTPDGEMVKILHGAGDAFLQDARYRKLVFVCDNCGRDLSSVGIDVAFCPFCGQKLAR